MSRYILLLLTLSVLQGYSQKVTFGDVTLNDLLQEQDDVFPDEHAIVLYKNVDFNFGRVLVVHERIKVYSSEGFEYADWIIPYENVKDLKASTYNAENGEIIVSEVSRANIFVEKVSKDEEIQKLSFPNVKEGSIIELTYNIEFVGLNTIYTQEFLPIKKLRVNIYNPKGINLNIRENPLVTLPIKKINTGHNQLFTGTNIPPLKREKFVGNINNYRGKILIEFYRSYITTTWGFVARIYRNVDWFGKELSRSSGYFRSDIRNLVKNETDTLKIAKKIDTYLKETINWDGYYSRGSENLKKIYTSKEGDSGDINLLLTAILRDQGINANPMLVATKRYGRIMFPHVRAFNAVVCAVKVDNETYLLDASRKNAAFAQIPTDFINGDGFIIYDNDSEFHPLKLKDHSKNTLIVSTQINPEDLSVTGEVKKRITNYFAWKYRDFFEDAKDGTYKDQLDEIEFLTVENFETENVDNPNLPLTLAYNFQYEDYIEKIDDVLYLEPLLYLGSKENLFNEDNRIYPIDLDFPQIENYIINFKIPEGYKVESLPQPKHLQIEEDIGSLKFNTQQIGGNVQVSLAIQLNDYLISAEYYNTLTRLYDEYVNISKSKIVLSKL